MVKSPVVRYNRLVFVESASQQQFTLRNYWLKPNGIQVN
jgi:hypothetical protein